MSEPDPYDSPVFTSTTFNAPNRSSPTTSRNLTNNHDGISTPVVKGLSPPSSTTDTSDNDEKRRLEEERKVA